MTSATDFDVIVIGGGPAGATTAALLARKGRRVVLLEKSERPRYKVGESLMPYCYFTLDRLGVVERMKQIGYQEKHAVQFVSTNGKVSAPFYFSQHYKHDSARTWHVDRESFDAMLLDQARADGADVRMGVNVREAVVEDGAVVGVRAQDAVGEAQTFRSAMTVDASGRDCFSINRNDWRVPDPKLKKIAVWTYYRGAKHGDDAACHATTVAYLPEKGWFWYIPLSNGDTSVGVVAERDYLYREGKDPQSIFKREIQNNDWIAERLADAEQVGEFRVTGDYSYRSRHCAANGLVLVGDAFAFLDPVFSSGVFLALRTGEIAADAVDAALKRGDVSAGQFEDYGRAVCEGMERMRKLVYAFYDQAFSFKDVMMKYPQLRGELTDCLIGDLFRDLGPLFEAVGEFAEMPEPLEHGRPLVSA